MMAAPQGFDIEVPGSHKIGIVPVVNRRYIIERHEPSNKPNRKHTIKFLDQNLR